MFRQWIHVEKNITLLYAFILPMLLVLPAFAATGIYPFGEKSLLIIDMHNEYIDYLAQLNETVRSSGSFLRSWNMGMGLNMLGLIAFYTASPFNLIVLLLPLACITEAVFAVTLLKLGTAGLLFALFSREVFPEAGRVFHVVFSAAYALSAYNIAYSSNIMWLDGSAFLPLVLLGVERILSRGSYNIFLFSLIYVFFTSYYIGYMIGVFAFLYFTARYFASQSKIRAYLHMLARFIGSAALAAGCCAFLLLPAFLNLRDGQSQMWDIPFETRLRYPLIRLASKLLPGVYDSLTDAGLPNIYCTVFAISLCFLYFCTSAVPRREKMVFGGLLAVILLSFSCEILDLAWHAFEDPTWFPARYSFVFSFWVLFLALRCAILLDKISRREILSAVLLLLLLFIEIAVNRFRFMELRKVLIGLALLIIYSVLLFICKSKNRRPVYAVLVLLVCMEVFYNSAYMVRGMDRQFEYKNRAEYREFMRDYGDAAMRLKSLDGGVYRTEILGQRGANGAMALGYNSISHYSTTTNQELNAFLRRLGYNKGTNNELRFAVSTPLTNGLMGIKYVISPEPICDAYELKESVGGLGIYENTAAWPLAFWSPESALDFSPDEKDNTFELQNKLASALSGHEVQAFKNIKPTGTVLENTEKIENGDHIEYIRQIRNKDSEIEFSVDNPRGFETYAFLPVYDERFASSEVFARGQSAGRDLAYRSNSIIPLGNEQIPTLRIVQGGERLRISGEYFAALDVSAAQKAAAEAAEYPLRFTAFIDTVVSGEITCPNDGLIATTFPYDSGWTVKIDGKKVGAVRLAGVFMAFPVSGGEHTVEMRYLPPGFSAGVIITLVTIIGIIVWFIKKQAVS